MRCIMKIYFVFKVTNIIIIFTGHRQTKKILDSRLLQLQLSGGWLERQQKAKRPTPNGYNNNLNGKLPFLFAPHYIIIFHRYFFHPYSTFFCGYNKIVFYCCALSVPLMVLLAPLRVMILSPLVSLIRYHHHHSTP